MRREAEGQGLTFTFHSQVYIGSGQREGHVLVLNLNIWPLGGQHRRGHPPLWGWESILYLRREHRESKSFSNSMPMIMAEMDVDVCKYNRVLGLLICRIS